MQFLALEAYTSHARRLLADHAFLGIIVGLFLSLSIGALWFNAAQTHYIGNNYFPLNMAWISISLLLIYFGLCLQYNKHHMLVRRIREVFFLFGSMALMILGTNAIQYTPFSSIDQHILHWGAWMHVDLASLVAWSAHHPMLYKSMTFIYESLSHQLTYLPLIFVFLGRFERLYEYYFLLLLTALIGFSFYYFFPTTAPASVIDSPYFTTAQHATELKFKQIHDHIKPTTREGGMIALPSFHVIWAWLCVWLVREWVWAFRLLLLLNTGIAASCVLLGWHYLLDIIASIIILSIAHTLYALSSRRLLVPTASRT